MGECGLALRGLSLSGLLRELQRAHTTWCKVVRPRPRTLEEEMASIKYSDSKMSAFAMIKYTDKEFESIRAKKK